MRSTPLGAGDTILSLLLSIAHFKKGEKHLMKKHSVECGKCAQDNELAQLKDRFVFYESMEKLLGERGYLSQAFQDKQDFNRYAMDRAGWKREAWLDGVMTLTVSEWISPTAACSILGPQCFYSAVRLVPSHHCILKERWLVMLKITCTSCIVTKQRCLGGCQWWNKAVLEDCGYEDNWYSSFFFLF